MPTIPVYLSQKRLKFMYDLAGTDIEISDGNPSKLAQKWIEERIKQEQNGKNER